jgi:hypothetical protein
MPRILSGWLPTTRGAQHIGALIKAGQIEAVKQLVAEMDREINRQADK